MNALTLTLIRLAFLAVLWLFVIAAVGVVRTDLFGPSGTGRRPGRKRQQSRSRPAQAAKPATPAKPARPRSAAAAAGDRRRPRGNEHGPRRSANHYRSGE
jgi:hypothetical protein